MAAEIAPGPVDAEPLLSTADDTGHVASLAHEEHDEVIGAIASGRAEYGLPP